ncbi:uncharacterized protein LOC117903980 [Vitis riparia]|uniref:uncharacterized protein LOC117903980 n=1 Tax=Vitis riparia TaxID=96939 RepID=UPI00155A1FBB|nr:uncharacterized protein LOC117903980 [Vitis riparia]
MASPSPALSNTSNDTTTTATTTTATTTNAATAALANIAAAAAAAATPSSITSQPKNLRGLNKPKCIQCGNVARSRCPYQSCKSCCAKAQNPCHIHVLKANATFPDRTPSSSSPLFDQQSTEVSPSGTSLRVASLRQLSNNFAQFNNVQMPLRSRKPLTRKDAATINEWRFSKLKEYKNRNIEVENEAFDRYMQNISLLEEVFSVKSTPDGTTDHGISVSDAASPNLEDNSSVMVSWLKLRLKSNPTRSDNSRKRILEIVDRGLKKLNYVNGLNDQNELPAGSKRPKTGRADRLSALSELIDKLNKARNEEDLNSCMEMKSQIFNTNTETSQAETEEVDTSTEQTAKDDLAPMHESNYTLPKFLGTTEIDQESLNNIDAHFSTTVQIEDL